MNVSLFQAASALDANSRWQEVIADNLASSSLPGYKQQQLSQAAVQAGLMPGQSGWNASQHFSIPQTAVSTNFNAGELKYTGDGGNVALEGPGFLEVQLPNGQIALTRDGEFHKDAKGLLVTKESFPVLGSVPGLDGPLAPIQLDPSNAGTLSVSSTGLISQGSTTVGQLAVTAAAKPELLTKISGAYFLAQNPKVGLGKSSATLREGYLETSNASTLGEMASMMTASRGFEANQKVIQLQDDRLNRTISELGNPT
ncbi:MAG TPA: flagellar hook basal-body protein [Verrucomicrobiae bacterium]